MYKTRCDYSFDTISLRLSAEMVAAVFRRVRSAWRGNNGSKTEDTNTRRHDSDSNPPANTTNAAPPRSNHAVPSDTADATLPQQTIPQGPALDFEVLHSAQEFIEKAQSFTLEKIRKQEATLTRLLLHANPSDARYNLYCAQFQLIRIAKGLNYLKSIDVNEQRKLRAWLAGLKKDLDESLCQKPKDAGWEDDEVVNYKICEPGSLVYSGLNSQAVK